jgi:hypothetical protein
MTPAEPITGRLSVLGSMLLLVLAVALALARAAIVADTFADYGVDPGTWFWSVLLHDAGLVALVAAALAAALGAGRPWLRLPLVLLALAVVLLMLADVATRHQLYQRLYVTDLVKFGKELGALWTLIGVHARHWAGLLALLAGCALALLALCALLPQRHRHRRLAAALALLALAAAAAFAARGALATRSTFSDQTLNLVEVNADLTVDRPYSDAFRAGLARWPAAAQACTDGLAQPVDIVLVVVESLSVYQSRLQSGLNDMTPALDALTPDAAWFDGFLANGFTTDHGLIALLAGRDPTPAFGRYSSMNAYHGFAGLPDTLPRRLARHGFHTAFMANSDLSFLDKGAWLATLGFDHIEGHDHPSYEGAPRSHFGSAPDGMLFDRAADWIAGQPADRRFALVLTTTSSHPPFTHPVSGERSEDATFRYVDEVTAGFASRLRGSGFLDRGLLLVTSDHRAMTPLRPGEAALYGESALARIPLLAFGRHPLPGGRHGGLYQQTDLPASLEHLVAGSVCRPAHTGLLFAQPALPPRQVVHARGDRRSQVDVFVDGQRHALRLAGDASDWVGSPPADAAAIAARIHRERAQRGSVDGDDELLDYYIRHLVPQRP